MSTVANRYLEGNFGPVADEVTAHDLPVTGTIPAQLCGRYLRNGPNPAAQVDAGAYHWFSGDGMVHGIRLADGRAEWYRNRWVRSPAVSAALGDPPIETDLDPDRVAFAPNTNVIGHAGRTLTLVEGGSAPYELDDELATIGPTDFSGTLPGAFSAHPKRDPATGALHVVAYHWAWGNQIQYLVVNPKGRVSRTVDVAVGGPIMVHDLAVTETHAVLFDLPVTFDVEAAMGGAGFPYRWNPDYLPRVGLLPLDATTDETRWFEVEPCYVFHPLNAYDDGERVIVDLVRHPSMFNRSLNGPAEGTPTLERWTLDSTSTTVREERLDDRGQEFPRMDERRLGRRHRFGYTTAAEVGIASGATLKHDLDKGTSETRNHGRGRVASEPIFVPRSGDAAEDDGWLMALAYDNGRDGSDLVIWSAQDFLGPAEAVIELPQRVPYGFHGNWVPDPS